jgi:hypothetical protein
MTRWEITEYDDIIRAIATRRNSLGMSQEMVNYKTGLADNYVKIEAQMRRLGNLSLPAFSRFSPSISSWSRSTTSRRRA